MPAATVLPKYVKDATLAHKVGKIVWIGRGPAWVAGALLAAANVGCAAEASDQTVETRITTETTDTRIFGGAKDDDSDAIPGVVALRVGVGSTFELCSGALIAPNVVLTARHCVTKNATSSVSCDENGRSANGRHVTDDEDPTTIGVYLGASPSFARPPVSTGRAIVAPAGPYLCDSDIALLVLDKPIPDVAPIPVRIHSAARRGELIRSVGYGQNDKSSPIGTRFRRAGVAVLAQGKGVSASKTPLGAHEFEVGQSICQGDSGGPAISEETGAVIGVVSRGGGCGDDFGHIYTTTAGFDSLMAHAFELSGTRPTVEEGDAPGNGPSTRSKSTAPSGDTPAAPTQSHAGCSVTPQGAATGPATAGLAALAAVAALGARRRRRVF